MPIFVIEQYETWVQRYSVKANSKAEAIKMVFDGDTDPSQEIDSPEYISIDDNIGMSIEACDISREELSRVGIRNDDFIPSIRSVQELKGD